MAAPVPVVRQDPDGIKLRDGYRSLIAFGRYPDLAVFEIEVAAPGIDGGEPIDTTTQHNDDWRSMAARQLKTLTAFDVVCAMDPVAYNAFVDMVNVDDVITRLWSDGSTLTFYGYLRSITKDADVEGTMPRVTLNIQPTNTDHDNDYVEAGPVVVEVAGT